MTIEERFERLEKEVQTLREQKGRLRKLSLASITLALAALIGGTALSVRAWTAVIEPLGVITQNILLKDGTGKVRVALNSSGQLSLYDANGKTRVFMDATGGLAQLYDANGALRTRILPGAVQAVDANGKVRAAVDSAGNFYSYDATGKARALVSSSGYVAVYDSNGVNRVLVNGYENKIYFYSASNQIIATHP